MSFDPVWGGPIAWYLFLAGLGAGAFVTSAFLRWRHPGAVKMRKAGHVIAPIVVIAGLLLLVVDAEAGFHNPLRFALLLTNPFSVMTWGVVFLTVFIVVSLLVLLIDLLKKQVPAWLEVVGVVFALCVAGYTGALLGVVQTFPLWNHPLLPILFVVSAMSTGIASVVFYGELRAHEEIASTKPVSYIHYGLVATEILMVAFMLFILNLQSTDAHATVVSLVAGNYAILFWVLFIAVGLVLPFIADTWALFCPAHKEGAGSRAISAASEAGVMVGGFFLRYLVIVAALPAGFVAGLVF